MRVPNTPSKYQSYALTIRPLDGATDIHDDILCRFVRKYCEYYYIVSEKTDYERHLHAGIFMKKMTSRSDLSIMLKRIFKDFSPEEKRVLNQGIRIMYNIDFVENYLDKDDDTELILQNLPEAAHLEAYWPPSKEQEKAKARAAVDKYYANLEYLWYQHQNPSVEVTYETCCRFLSRMMYSDRLIRVLRDDRAISQTARHLSRYIRKDDRYIPSLAAWETL